MLMIRLARFGAKKKPFYRVVVIEKERARDSRNLEVVGQYNPLTEPATGEAGPRAHRALDEERRADVGNRGRLVKNNPAAGRRLSRRVSRAADRRDARFRRGKSMKQLIEDIAKALVDIPEEVDVNVIEGEQTTVLELKVAPSDLGKVIGKQGRTARSIRTILGAAGMKLNRRFTLEILE